MKKLRLLLLIVMGLTLTTPITAFAQEKYATWDDFHASYGYKQPQGNLNQVSGVGGTYTQVWNNKIGPTAPTRASYLNAAILHICKTTISDSCYIRADRTKIYPKRNYPYVAYVTYKQGSEDVTCNYDYYLPCTKHSYYVTTGRSGDFSFYNVNGTHYKKDNSIKISANSYISYTDYSHTGGDVYGAGTITFRIAHSPNGSWCERIGGERLCA